MDTTETLVVGAGPTGLGAAWACERQARPYRLVDAGARAGGLATTVDLDGYRWDLGGHVIHSHFADFDAAVEQSGVRMADVARTGSVLLDDGGFVPTPVQQQLDEIPSDIRPGAPSANLAEYFRHEMGQELYDSFFRPLSVKTWAHPPEDMDHAWTSLRSGSVRTNVPRVGLRSPGGPTEHFPYPEKGSGSLWDGVAAGLDPTAQRYGTRLVDLDLEGHVARFDDATQVRYERLVSTAPLDQLCAMAGDEACRRLGSELVHTQVSLLGFGVRGPVPEALQDKTYIYCASPEVVWLRATVLSNYSPAMAPEGCWNILFEISAPLAAAGAGTDGLAERCLESLVALGVDTDRVERRWSRSLAYGYPVPTLGRDDALRTILATFEAKDVSSRGRFGGWRYESCNQDYSFAQGVEAVTSGTDAVLWRPGDFSVEKGPPG